MLVNFKQQLREHLSHYPEVIFALLYGSALEISDFHNLDIGVFVDRKLVPQESDLDYSLSLSDELTRQLDFPADVRVINHSPLGFQYNVSRGEYLLINDDWALARFRERAWDMWFDFEPVAKPYLRELR